MFKIAKFSKSYKNILPIKTDFKMKNKQSFICLPYFFKPNFKTELTRLGRDNDGGYCIPKASLKDTSILYSIGLGDDWSFEKQFRKQSGAKIVCIDHSIIPMFWIKRFIKDLIKLFLLKSGIKEHFQRFFSFLYYKRFFNNSETIHAKFFFGTIGQYMPDMQNVEIIDMDTILKRWIGKAFFLKIDIEGNEYRVLDQIIQYQERLSGLVIEFHNCDLMSEKIKLFIEKLDLDLVHIHVNNFGIITKDGFPTVIELTFSPKQYNSKREKNENDFPVKSLDQPNNKNEKDVDVSFLQ